MSGGAGQLCKIVAVIRRQRLQAVEERLLRERVPGITVSPVKGYGEYADYFSINLLVPHVRLEIFTTEDAVERLVSAIVEAAHTGEKGDGFVGVVPVSRITRIRTGAPPGADDL